jgi:DNA-binding MarR family transcriptional regulator
MTAKEICDRGGIHKTKVSRAVAALGKKRFLTSAELPNDRRHEELTLTRAGLAAYSDLSREAAQFDFQLVNKISDADQQVLRRCLRQIARL